MKKAIKMIHPKSHDKVGAFFEISGFVPISWLKNSYGLSNSILLDFIDINGKAFIGSSASVFPNLGWFSKYKKRMRFKASVQFDQINAPFIIESQGMITLRFRGQDKGQEFFLPINIIGSNPNFVPDPKLTAKHKKIKETVLRHEREMEEYANKLNEIWKRREEKSGISEYKKDEYVYIQNQKLSWGIFNILEELDNIPENNPFAEEDLEIRKLEEQYQEVIEIEGPICGANILTYCGFHFIIYSNDHDRHLHVIHKGRMLNVRISFPEIMIDSYISGTLKSKDEKKIISFLKLPENFNKLKEEFSKKEKYI